MKSFAAALVLSSAAMSLAGREAVYTAAVNGATQTLSLKRLTSSTVQFRLQTDCPKARCHDMVTGEASQNPFAVSSASQKDFAAEEYVYQKGKCRLAFRVDMESATMVKVVAACPEHNRKKCPLNLGSVLNLKR